MKKLLLLLLAFTLASPFTKGQGTCSDVAILVAASFDTLVLCQSNAKHILANGPLSYEWTSTTMDGATIDTSTGDRFFTNVKQLSLTDTFIVCLKLKDTLNNTCGLCDTFVYKGRIENWRAIKSNQGQVLSIPQIQYISLPEHENKLYDLLGRPFESFDRIPYGTIFIEGRKKKVKLEQ